MASKTVFFFISSDFNFNLILFQFSCKTQIKLKLIIFNRIDTFKYSIIMTMAYLNQYSLHELKFDY